MATPAPTVKRPAQTPLPLTHADARRLWLRAQRLDTPAPFGEGPAAVAAAIGHLGYVQIDTINVIERSHHHILATRIPGYRRGDLATALSGERSVFEYWAHALAYIPTADYRFFLPLMRRWAADPGTWFGSVDPAEVRRLLARIRRDGPLSIRDIDDGVRVDKDHPWASRKPAKRALEYAFFSGQLTVGARTGMIKTYELASRHFGWTRTPRPATDQQGVRYRLDRALRAQGAVSLDSACYLDAAAKKPMAALIEAEVARRRLVPVAIDGAPPHWIARDALPPPEPAEPRVHILSPFDPLVIQRKRLAALFGYEHLFEAYLPREKRRLGYFALPVLVGDRIAAAIDLKADRAQRRLLIQQWTWTAPPREGDRAAIDAALARFEAFQFGE